MGLCVIGGNVVPVLSAGMDASRRAGGGPPPVKGFCALSHPLYHRTRAPMSERWLSAEMEAFMEQSASLRNRLKGRYRYYHADDRHFFQKIVPPDASALVAGCDVLPIAE